MKHKRDFEKAAKELEALRKENQELQALRKPGDGKVVLVCICVHFSVVRVADRLLGVCRMYPRSTTTWTAKSALVACGHPMCKC